MSKKQHNQFILAVLVLAVFGGSWWIVNKNQALQPRVQPITQVKPKQGVQLVTPKEFVRLAQKDDAFVLDVHVPEQKHIPNTDAFIPFNQLTVNQDKLPKDKSVPILVYCRSGGMSAQASKELIKMGYTQVYDLEGGLNAYSQVFGN